MARMFLAGCLWHAICLTFSFADSQCVDGQDSQREAAGLKSPSLVQLHAGRKTTLELDTSSESLVGFSQMVQDLAEKVAGHNYTLKKAESDAIKLIRKWIENMNKTLNVQHKEDQAEVDRVRDLIRGCTSSTKGLLTINVSGYNQTVITDRNAHKNCRVKQDAIADLENVACEDYDKYRKGLTPYLNGDEVPPSCLASLTKDKVATSVPATQDSMETCLVGTHTWLIPLYTRYKLCDRRNNNRTNITKRCDKLQEIFESSFCSYELKLSDTCDYHSTCRKRELEDRSNTHDEVKISEQARKADYVTGRKVSCLFDVFVADNPNKTATLQRCRALQISTSPFDIIYHPVPPGEPCFKEPSKPCDEAWTTKEYGQLSAKAKTCTPCPAPKTAQQGWILAMRFKSTGSIFDFDSPYWTDSRTYNDGDPNPLLDEDAKFEAFNSRTAVKIRGCLQSCLEYDMPSASSLRSLFANTPIAYTGAGVMGQKAEALTWLGSSGLSKCASNQNPNWGAAGINLADTVSAYKARVRFGGLLNNEGSVNTVNDAVGFGAREAGGKNVGAGLACWPHIRNPLAGTIWIYTQATSSGGGAQSSSHGGGVLLLASTLLTEKLGDFSSGQQVGSLANMDQADYRIGKTGAEINKLSCQKIRWETQSGRKKEWAGPFDFSKLDSISQGCNSASISQIKSGLWWHAGGSGCYGSKHFGLSTTNDVHSYCSSNGAKHWGHFHRGGVNTGIYMWENDCFNENEGQERFYLYCVGGSA